MADDRLPQEFDALLERLVDVAGDEGFNSNVYPTNPKIRAARASLVSAIAAYARREREGGREEAARGPDDFPWLEHAIECCDAWEPEVRIIGNVPAKALGDMLRALREISDPVLSSPPSPAPAEPFIAPGYPGKVLPDLGACGSCACRRYLITRDCVEWLDPHGWLHTKMRCAPSRSEGAGDGPAHPKCKAHGVPYPCAECERDAPVPTWLPLNHPAPDMRACANCGDLACLHREDGCHANESAAGCYVKCKRFVAPPGVLTVTIPPSPQTTAAGEGEPTRFAYCVGCSARLVEPESLTAGICMDCRGAAAPGKEE